MKNRCHKIIYPLLLVPILFTSCPDEEIYISEKSFLEKKYSIICEIYFSCFPSAAEGEFETESECTEILAEENIRDCDDIEKDGAEKCLDCLRNSSCDDYDSEFWNCREKCAILNC